MDFDALAKAIDASALQEKILTQILTLAVEYEEKNITAQRFSDRCLEILQSYGEAAKKLRDSSPAAEHPVSKEK